MELCYFYSYDKFNNAINVLKYQFLCQLKISKDIVKLTNEFSLFVPTYLFQSEPLPPIHEILLENLKKNLNLI